jgi:membrane protease YdiL (CAAX protease family)
MASAPPIERLVSQMNGRRGVLVYAAVVMAGVTAVAVLLHSMNLAVDDRRAALFVMAAMWTPALARLVATRTVDRTWRPPFSLRRWGKPRFTVVLMPLLATFDLVRGLGEELGWRGYLQPRLRASLGLALPSAERRSCIDCSVVPSSASRQDPARVAFWLGVSGISLRPRMAHCRAPLSDDQ